MSRKAEGAAALPQLGVPGLPVVRRVHPDRHVSVDHALPEGVELGEGEGAEPLEARDGRGPDEDDLGAALHHPLQLTDGLIDYGQRHDRSGEDPVVVVETPRLVHPLVEGMDHHVCGSRLRPQPLLQEAGERRPHQSPIEAELIHHRQTRLGGEEGFGGPHGLAHDLASRLALRVADLEELLLGARPGHDREGRVGDVIGNHVPHRDLVPPVDLDVLDQALVIARQKLGEGVRSLVHVIVGVKDGKAGVLYHQEPPGG
jgi:hypothetical protein